MQPIFGMFFQVAFRKISPVPSLFIDQQVKPREHGKDGDVHFVIPLDESRTQKMASSSEPYTL